MIYLNPEGFYDLVAGSRAKQRLGFQGKEMCGGDGSETRRSNICE